MPENEPHIVRIPDEQVRARKRLATLLTLPLRHEFHIQEPAEGEVDGWTRATEAAKNGAGTLILWNHFNKRNGFDIAKDIIIANEELVDRLSVFPVSEHQRSKPKSLIKPLDYLEEHAAFQYPYIVTKDTLKKEGYEDYELNAGIPVFRDLSRESLGHAGTVSMTFGEGRFDHLDEDATYGTVGAFIGSMMRGKEPVTNFGVLLVGLGEEGRKEYDLAESSGLRPFTKAQVTVGEYFTLEELMQHPEVNNRLKNVDPFIRSQFKPIVPEAFLHAPTDETRAEQRAVDHEKRVALAKKGVIFLAAGAAVASGLYAASRTKNEPR